MDLLNDGGGIENGEQGVTEYPDDFGRPLDKERRPPSPTELFSVLTDRAESAQPTDDQKPPLEENPDLFPPPGTIAKGSENRALDKLEPSLEAEPAADNGSPVVAVYEPFDEPRPPVVDEDLVYIVLNDLRSIPRLIEEDLLKRTQWRQEQQKLDYCRKWLSESTEALHKAFRRRAHNKRLQNRKRLMEAVTQELLASPPTTDSEESSGKDTSSNEQLVSALSTDNDVNSADDLTKLHESYIRDLQAMQQQENTVKTLIDDIGNSSFNLEDQMRTLRDNMRAQASAEERRMGISEDDHVAAGVRSRSNSGTDTPTLIREYFDRVGDVGIFQERLLELTDTYEEGVVERDFVKDRGDVPPVSDQEFEDTYRARREAIERDLQQAQDESNALRKSCVKAGYDPDSHRKPKHSVYSSSYAPSYPYNVDQTAEYPQAQIQQLRIPIPIRQAEPSTMDASRVGTWLSAVPMNTAPPPENMSYEIDSFIEESILEDELADVVATDVAVATDDAVATGDTLLADLTQRKEHSSSEDLSSSEEPPTSGIQTASDGSHTTGSAVSFDDGPHSAQVIRMADEMPMDDTVPAALKDEFLDAHFDSSLDLLGLRPL